MIFLQKKTLAKWAEQKCDELLLRTPVTLDTSTWVAGKENVAKSPVQLDAFVLPNVFVYFWVRVWPKLEMGRRRFLYAKCFVTFFSLVKKK